jgi:hypothetical protein
MSKRLGVKLAVTVAALSAMTLLQGCVGEEQDSVLRNAWTPVGYPWTLFDYAGYYQGPVGGSGQGGTSSTSGGAAVASAISSAAGGGGGQVSAGGAM